MSNDNFKKAVFELFEKILEKYKDTNFKYPVNAYITGGVAVYFYTKYRVSDDIDVILDRDIDIPNDLSVEWENEEGRKELLMYDSTYNETFSIMPEEYESNSLFLKNIDDKINLYILSPLDLIISKIERFAPNDQEDIQNIIRCHDVSKDKLLETIFYEIDGRCFDKYKIKSYGYKLIEICEWINEKNHITNYSEEEINEMVEKSISKL